MSEEMVIRPMSKQRWLTIRPKGFWRYAIVKGVLDLGIIGGLLVLAVKYLSDSKFSFAEMSVREFIYGYLVWMLLALIVGFVLASLIWFNFERRFSE